MLGRRRANSAKGLLAAAAAAALISTTLLVGLASYSDAVIAAGGRAAVAAAPPQERAIQVRLPLQTTGNRYVGSGGAVDKSQAEAWARTDTALRESFTGRFGDTGFAAAGYTSGLRFDGDTGDAVPDAYGVVYARVMFLDELAEHARLVSGSWPAPGGQVPQTVVGEAAAHALGLRPGSRVSMTNGITKKTQQVEVSGVFAARSPQDPYWLLAPELADGVEPGGHTYGPLVLDRADFFAGWSYLGSSGWVATPDLSRAEGADLAAARAAAGTLDEVPEELGFSETGQASTQLERLIDRIEQARLVGRSDMLTPLLLIAILGGYALMLLASLLTEGRRAETALLRARGASRVQLGGLAAREALLIAAPGALLAPLLVTPLLKVAERLPALAGIGVRLEGGVTPLTIGLAAAAGLGCVLAMLLPALRGGATYVADLSAQSRPSRAAVAQRTGLDVALIGFAVLAWYQLQQYDSPLSGVAGRLGIDPLLASAGPLGVLAGAVLALRLLPPLTRLLERQVDRGAWFATQLGVWQAGRRPHAGPVLLLALSVAVSTLAWTLAATARQSQVDQADHTAGADLRLLETSWATPGDRARQVSALPGVTAALPAWRTTVTAGENETSISLLALDAAAAGDVLRMRADLGDSRAAAAGMAALSRHAPGVELPAGVKALRGSIRITANGRDFDAQPRNGSSVQLTDPHGGVHQVPLSAGTGGDDHAFEVPLPQVAGLRLTGFSADGPYVQSDLQVVTEFTGLATVDAAGVATGLNLEPPGVRWGAADAPGEADLQVAADSARVSIHFPESQVWELFSVTLRPDAEPVTVPVVATPEALAALHTEVGAKLTLPLWAPGTQAQVTGVVAALPGGSAPAALLVDMPSLATHLQQHGWRAPAVDEWWLTTEPTRHAEAAAAAAALPDLTMIDRHALAVHAADDAFGAGARIALFIAALGAIGLALVGIAVDVRATARRRVAELTVLNTLGAAPRLLARALMIEQALLAGLGVAVGLVVGLLVARTTGPLVIMTPSAGRPVPTALTTTDWLPVLGTAATLFAVTLVMAGLVATTLRQRLATSHLRNGADR
ncbi:ABC transporter permease [Catellatospora coxensis]|uniref:ABC3 transporter permease C-terminal domain-containing protein n=1 Tax=Catellatospora coxensis TaxID=310354 RepID=A0A8J3LF17_9ACTN|nr:ABC transporter permease [Catellatospora coxensis]GIG11520.1 hypothetical protein Cco03nite_82200 [Catellatospora coxensis]